MALLFCVPLTSLCFLARYPPLSQTALWMTRQPLVCQLMRERFMANMWTLTTDESSVSVVCLLLYLDISLHWKLKILYLVNSSKTFLKLRYLFNLILIELSW